VNRPMLSTCGYSSARNIILSDEIRIFLIFILPM
jgi:hypothetical protein